MLKEEKNLLIGELNQKKMKLKSIMISMYEESNPSITSNLNGSRVRSKKSTSDYSPIPKYHPYNSGSSASLHSEKSKAPWKIHNSASASPSHATRRTVMTSSSRLTTISNYASSVKNARISSSKPSWPSYTIRSKKLTPWLNLHSEQAKPTPSFTNP